MRRNEISRLLGQDLDKGKPTDTVSDMEQDTCQIVVKMFARTTEMRTRISSGLCSVLPKRDPGGSTTFLPSANISFLVLHPGFMLGVDLPEGTPDSAIAFEACTGVGTSGCQSAMSNHLVKAMDCDWTAPDSQKANISYVFQKDVSRTRECFEVSVFGL